MSSASEKKLHIHLRLTAAEEKYFQRLASTSKHKTSYIFLQNEIIKLFGSAEVHEEVCSRDKKKVEKSFKVSREIAENIIKTADKIGISPTELIHRMILGPRIQEILKMKCEGK